MPSFVSRGEKSGRRVYVRRVGSCCDVCTDALCGVRHRASLFFVGLNSLFAQCSLRKCGQSVFCRCVPARVAYGRPMYGS